MITDFDKENKGPTLSHTLAARASELGTWLCVGIDPQIERLPAGIPKNAAGVETFCLRVIESTRDVALAFKINFAFFEALGPFGWRVLERVRAAIPPGTLALADAKRGDIGSTSAAYARSIFDVLRFDAVTVNPYLGWDALDPFLEHEGKLVFVLCKTSNPGASAYQDRVSDGVPLYLQIARDAAARDSNAEIGLVVGATQPESLRTIRSELESIPLLVPGVGAQGAEPGPVMDLVCTNGLIAVSRQILYASSGSDFAQAAGDEARRLAPLCWKPDAD